MATDDRGQVSSWLVKLLVGMAIVGFIVIEFGSVLINRVQAADIAGQAATEAGLVYSNRRNIDAAEKRAEEFCEQNGAEFVDLAVNEQEDTISVTLRKEASTRVLHRIDALEGIIEVTVTESAPLRN